MLLAALTLAACRPCVNRPQLSPAQWDTQERERALQHAGDLRADFDRQFLAIARQRAPVGAAVELTGRRVETVAPATASDPTGVKHVIRCGEGYAPWTMSINQTRAWIAGDSVFVLRVAGYSDRLERARQKSKAHELLVTRSVYRVSDIEQVNYNRWITKDGGSVFLSFGRAQVVILTAPGDSTAATRFAAMLETSSGLLAAKP